MPLALLGFGGRATGIHLGEVLLRGVVLVHVVEGPPPNELQTVVLATAASGPLVEGRESGRVLAGLVESDGLARKIRARGGGPLAPAPRLRRNGSGSGHGLVQALEPVDGRETG